MNNIPRIFWLHVSLHSPACEAIEKNLPTFSNEAGYVHYVFAVLFFKSKKEYF